MTRDQQLTFCKVCKNHQFDTQLGIICSLTGRQADFQTTCVNFHSDLAIEEVRYQAQEKEITQVLASTGKRFANYLIDSICLFFLYFMFAFLGGIFLGVFFEDRLYALEEDMQRYNLLFVIIIYLGYYTITESSSGRTLGKLITGTKVVDKNGKIPGTGKIILRSLSRWVPFEAFSFFGSTGRGWHDEWTDTYVVDVKN